MTNFQEAISNLISQHDGYQESDRYPAAFQVVDFPKFADVVRITGNNQAFFFARAEKDSEGNITGIVEDTKNLKSLIREIYDSGNSPDSRTKFHMQIDADVFNNPDAFIQKYQSLRAEPTLEKREELLGQEVKIIKDFVENDGIHTLVKEVISEARRETVTDGTNRSLPEPVLNALATKFLTENFKLEGVVVDGKAQTNARQYKKRLIRRSKCYKLLKPSSNPTDTPNF